MKVPFFSLFFFYFTCLGYSQEFSGRVVAIADGDTFTFLTTEKEQVKVRLAEIDTPESAQPYGTRARQALSDLIFGKQVNIIKADTDRYGRLVGHVYVDDIHVNKRMVQEGMAWVYRQYLEDESLLLVEEEARRGRRGLWSLPNSQQVPPWEWRRGERSTSSVVDNQEENKPQFECGTKRYCKEMSSCEEARYYLENCGLTRLDGDGDGIPCEALCQ